MEIAKLTDFLTILIFICKSMKFMQSHKLIECLNNPSEYLEELHYFFLMADVEKRKAILVA